MSSVMIGILRVESTLKKQKNSSTWTEPTGRTTLSKRKYGVLSRVGAGLSRMAFSRMLDS